jgi:hypothetical protein
MIGTAQHHHGSFAGSVIQALDTIASGPSGRKLIDAIVLAGSLIHTTRPYKVGIVPSGTAAGLSIFVGPSASRFAGNNATRADRVDLASGGGQIAKGQADRDKNWRRPPIVEPFNAPAWMEAETRLLSGGIGSPSVVSWNPGKFNTPDGHRPPFIGLAHELVHALHNLEGNTSRVPDVDERRVTGLYPFEHRPITENSIRADHNIPARASYSGLDHSARFKWPT